MGLPGTGRSKCHNLLKLANIILVIVHSNAEEEYLFSRVRKNLASQRASLSVDGTMSSILTFQLMVTQPLQNDKNRQKYVFA